MPTQAERLTNLGETVDEIKSAVTELRKDVQRHDKDFDQLAPGQLRERIAVLEAHVADLKKAKDESDKRQWQFVYIFAGAVVSLLVTVVVQLVLALVRKP